MVQWRIYCDNGHLYYKDKSVIEWFLRVQIKIDKDDEPAGGFPVYLNHFYTKSTEEFIERKYIYVKKKKKTIRWMLCHLWRRFR